MKTKKVWTVFLAFLLLLSVIGSAQTAQSDITLAHEHGEVKIQTNPEKVVVFDYGLLDALDAAGVTSIKGVPKSSRLPQHLTKYAASDYVNVGSLLEADYEAINALKPNLILITGRMSAFYKELSAIAPTLYLEMPGATYFETFEKNIGVLAKICTNEADKLTGSIANVKTRAAKIKETASGKRALIIQATDDAFSVFGYGSRYAVVYTDFGFTLTDEGIGKSSHGQASSFEYLAEQNPEYLFVVDRSAAIGAKGGAAALLDNELVRKMDAAKNGKIFYLDSANWYTVSGGVQSTQSMLGEMEAALGIAEK